MESLLNSAYIDYLSRHERNQYSLSIRYIKENNKTRYDGNISFVVLKNSDGGYLNVEPVDVNNHFFGYSSYCIFEKLRMT